MTEKAAGGERPFETDAELQAIRSLVQVNKTEVAVRATTEVASQAASPTQSTRQEATALPNPAARKMLPPVSASEDTGAVDTEDAPGKATIVLRRASAWALHQIKTYRPIRKNILWTSLVLLLLLKPFMVIGWTITLIVTVCVVFFALGADTFWRKVISLYQGYRRRYPEAARVLKVRSYAMAKKWDRLLNRLPDRMADVLRVPDLRALVKADARHDAALSDRLTRLRDDPLADF